MFGFLLFYSLINLFFDNAGMESGECSRMIGRCTEHFFCLKIGKIDVTGSDVDIGVIALCQFLISTAVIFDHTKGRMVFRNSADKKYCFRIHCRDPDCPW